MLRRLRRWRETGRDKSRFYRCFSDEERSELTKLERIIVPPKMPGRGVPAPGTVLNGDTGQPMTCLLCARWVNPGGLYCPEHDR